MNGYTLKSTLALSAAAALAAGFLTGCGGGGGDTTADTTATTTYDVTVERGPVLHAVVIDSAGVQAIEVGNGRYRFQNAPAYPVMAVGGYIDVDRDGKLSVGDVSNTLVYESEEGTAATMVSTVATRAEIRAWLKEQFGLTDATIDDATPSTNRTVAAISDELYAYCIEHNLSDAKEMTLTQMEQIRNEIAARIQTYTSENVPVADLESQLMDELDVKRLDDTDIQNIQNFGGGQNVIDAALALPESNLTDDQKYTLAYMWNEEKLAKDIYLALNELYPSNTFYNIATRSETTHEAAVQALVEKYDLNITNLVDYTVAYSQEELEALQPGEYAVPEVQELYDTLYAKGQQSLQDALEVGCMVEVTDVEDLDRDIETAQGAEDLVLVYGFLRSGSYNHYWAFDRALKNMGVAEGCCVLGDEYCKTPEEFPATNNAGQGPHGQTAQ
ncbi:DUF2202 domain-containing protein [Hydrogenimonas sp.]